jgi:crotonobetainyl-CoA:carnitine CoA-transferase CaiB-like acyl-CoA transferase
MPGAFDGVSVLDLTHVLAGPFSAYRLAPAPMSSRSSLRTTPIARAGAARTQRGTHSLGLTYEVQGGKKRLALDLRIRAGAILLRLARRRVGRELSRRRLRRSA